MCTKGQVHITADPAFADPRPKQCTDELVGPRCESVIDVAGASARCLLDTGSQVSTVSLSFYEKHLGNKVTLEKLEQLVNIEVAGGHQLPYHGFIETQVTFHKSVTGSSEPLDVLFLVVEDTKFNLEVPVLLGTNILKYCLQLCKDSLTTKYGSFSLNKSRVSKSWKMVYRCLSTQVNDSSGSAMLCNSDSVSVSANSEIVVDCHVNDDAFYVSGGCMLISSDGLTLPGGLIATPMLVSGDSAKDIWQVRVSNPTQVDVTIPVNTALGQVEQVNIVQMSAQVPSTDDSKSSDAMDVSNLFDLEHLNGLSDKHRQDILEMLNRNIDAISLHEFDLGLARGYKHTIKLEHGARPFRIPYRRIPPCMWEEVRDHIQKMLASGVIEPSTSSFASPIVLVRKKDNSLRFCVDYRRLNSVTIKDAHGLPRPQDIFDRLANAKWFSSLDLKSGYWQLEVSPEDRHYTSFTAGPLGFYQFVKMPFGLCNAGASFQRMMESCMGAENLSSCLLYLDDIVVFSETLEQHIERLDRVFTRLRDCGLKVNAKKCHLFKDKIKYLGHWITSDGISTDDDKIAAVKNWPIPTSREELKRFIGFASFYRRFIHRFAQISESLHLLLRGEKKKSAKSKKSPSSTLPPFVWGEEQQRSFEQLISALTSAPILAYADFTKPFILHTDAASSAGLGAILYQKDDEDRLRVIAYASRTLSDSERRYPVHKLEFLALKWAVTEKLADYLRGATFTVRTDNNPLTYVLTSAKLDACGQRWVAELCNFNFDIVYRPGSGNVDADALSRIPSQEWKQLACSTVHAVCESHLVSGFINCICLTHDYSCLFQDSEYGWWDKEIWIQEQESDDTIRQVLQVLDGQRQTVDSTEAKLLLRQRGKLSVMDGLLWRLVKIDDEDVSQVVVPTALRNEVLYQLHNKMGHLGIDRTQDLVRSRFYFPRMSTFISDYVTACDRCIRRKSPEQRAPMAKLESSGPLDLLCIDFLSLETSKGGYSNILVMTDHFTRYSQAIPTKDQKASTTAKALISSFVNHYGMPTRLHSDQGANFESKTIQQLCQIMGIKKTHTTSYHAQGNAQAERFNRSLLSSLSCLTEEEKTRWKDHLPYVVHAYNCTKNDATGYSPFQLMFGRKPRLPVDVIRGLDDPIKDVDYKEYVQSVKESLATAYEKASKYATEQHLKNKKLYDKKARATSLEVGDRVLVRRVAFKEGGPHKLSDKWDDGVYEVVGIPEGKFNVYDVRLEDNTKSKIRRLHRNLLLPLGHIEPHSVQKPIPTPRRSKMTEKIVRIESSNNDSESDDEVVISSRPTTRSRAANAQPSQDEEQTAEDNASQDVSIDVEETEETESEGANAAEATAPAVENAPQPTLRRSTRVRSRPQWQTSGEYVLDFNQQARFELLAQILDKM